MNAKEKPEGKAEREKLLAEGYSFYAELDKKLAEDGLEATREVWPCD